MSPNKELRQEIEHLKNKYMCPDLYIVPYHMSDSQLQKRQFDEEDLHFERLQNFTKNELLVPAFYQDIMDLPTVGSKFIRSTTNFYKGDLVQVTVEMGHWRLKYHDIRHKEYVTDAKNTVGFAYWSEQKRWALLNPKDWKKRKEELEQDLENPLLRQVELEFYYLLEEAAEARKTYVIQLTTASFLSLIAKLEELKWYLQTVPGLWAAFKLYSLPVHDLLLNRVKDLYNNALPKALKLAEEHESKVLDWKDYELLEEFEELIKPFLLEGYEVVEDRVYPNVRRMYTERQQVDSYASVETLKQYKEIASDLFYNSGQTSSFVWFNEVKSEYSNLY